MKSRKPNRLIKEKSPYLRQHAYNPVDWYPWGEEAFEKAKRENKPIFLSIGYSTCHWCHVMERESFEDPEIAEILNRHFVPVKVDREERPDIDALYMSVCQMMTGSGGWPLTVIMTPDKEPFFAGTYFPKESLYGRPGLREILLRVAELWERDPRKVIETAGQVVNAVREQESESYSGAELGETIIHRTFGNLLASYDEVWGGFGPPPKFPVPHNMMFLLRYFRRTGKEIALEMVVHTLTKMRLGGIWDHVGFGFHRYSTDREWLLPHFEKMLYDNALLMFLYSEAYQITRKELFARTVEEIAEYLLREMRSPEGPFFSAQDADSEGEEGKFYLWTIEELERVLKGREFEIALRIFGIEEEGNFLEEATRRKTGKNVLHMRKTLGEYAEELGIEEERLRQLFEEIRVKLFKERESRTKPLRDEKVLTDWNGLAVAAFSKAGLALSRKDFIDTAKRCGNFLIEKMKGEGGLLYHRYMEGEVGIEGFLEDYAYTVWGLTELYFATFEERYLREAVELCDRALEIFWDSKEGGFYQSKGEELFARKKEIYDGATPSGNSVMAYNLVRLARLTDRPELEGRARETLESFSQILYAYPQAHTFSMIALDLLVNGGFELRAEGMDLLRARKEMIALQSSFYPEGVFYLKETEKEGVKYFLCRDRVCESPVEDIELVREKLGKGSVSEEGGTPG
jgi:uncharacterized protein YyaL (SSP411 family)